LHDVIEIHDHHLIGEKVSKSSNKGKVQHTVFHFEDYIIYLDFELEGRLLRPPNLSLFCWMLSNMLYSSH